MHIFKHQSAKKPKTKDFLGFDSETESNGDFICAGLFGKGKKYTGEKSKVKSQTEDTIEEYFESEKELEDYINALAEQRYNFTIVSHNTEYDLKYLRNIVDTNSLLYSGSHFIGGELKNGFELMDTTNYFKMPLKKLIDVFDLKNKYGITKREGYLNSIEGKKEQVLDDAKAVFYLAKEIQDFFINNFNVSLRKTAPATTLAVFQSNYFFDKFLRSDKAKWKNNFERQGYYGGRCEIFRRGIRKVKSFDVNGMYVDIMESKKFPDPTYAHWNRDPEKIEEEYHKGSFMMLDITINIPDDVYIGLLPYRDLKRGKTIYPVGTWRGVYPSIELQNAEQYGLEIISFNCGLKYPRVEPFFSNYAKMTQEGRIKAKTENNEALNQLYKLMGNSLYGKFGQQNKDGPKYIKLDEYEGEIEGKLVKPDGNGVLWVIIPDNNPVDALHTFPVLPAFVTAYARIKLLNAMMANQENIVYCDTDSIKIDSNIRKNVIGIPVSKNPGEWGFEYEEEQEFYAPKVYGTAINRKRKGIPARAELIEKTETTEQYRFERPIKFKESIRRNLTQNEWVTQCKIIELKDDKREWVTETESRPIYVNEFDKNNQYYKDYPK